MKTGFFVVMNVGMQFLNTKIIPMVAQESQNKFSKKWLKIYQIIKNLEINIITLNKKLENDDDL